TQVLGAVVDVEFPAGELPEIYYALRIEREGNPLIAEVQTQLSEGSVRTVCMDTTDGLRRGTPVVNLGAPITVPVGPATLGRIFNVTGDALDGLGPVNAETSYPIHRPAPPFEEQVTELQVFETGPKVIDLIAPFRQG